MTITKIQSEGLAKPVDLADNEKIRLGTDNDFELYHTGSGAYIQNKTGTLYIGSNYDDDDGGDIRIQPKYGENSIVALDDGAVELYYDNVKTFATKSGGNTLTGTDASGNVSLGRFYYKQESGTVKALYDPYNSNFQLYDSVKATFGTSHDLKIWHDGSHSYIQNAGEGHLYIKDTGIVKIATDSFKVDNGDESKQVIKCNPDAGIELYYNNAKKAETVTGGLTVTGTLTADGVNLDNNENITLGNSNNMTIGTAGTSAFVKNEGSGALTMQVSNVEFNAYNVTDNEYLFRAVHGSHSYLYFDGASKMHTVSTGIEVNNNIKFTSPGGGAIYLGGTGSANALYDYEKGTFTPRFHGQGNNNTITTSTNIGEYVKVGRLVYVKMRVIFTDRNGANSALAMDGLPFSNAGNHTCTNLGRWANLQNHSVVGAFSGHIGDGSQEIEFNCLTSTGASGSDVNQTTDTTTVMLSFSYPAWGQ